MVVEDDKNTIRLVNSNFLLAILFCEVNVNNAQHHADGPAIIFNDGRIRYFERGKYHREAGPAMISPLRGYYFVAGKRIE